MIDILLALALVADAAPADPPTTPATEVAGEASPATVEVTEEKAKPKCRMEPVMGSRVRQQRVCDTPRYREAGDDARKEMNNFLNRSGNNPLPPSAGGG
ncbi:hypothetical protein GC169_07145 [bacterium]|nr:hypothetical protein [bacterium]